MDKFKKIFFVNKKISVFLFGVLILSIISGSLFPLFLNQSDKILTSSYLSDFVNNISNFDSISLLVNSLFNNCIFLIVLWILGISTIGCVIVIFLYFLKGFIIGFSLSSIFINFKLKGFLFAFFYLFPHHIINIVIYGVMTSYSLIFSIKFILFLFKKYEFNVRNSFKRTFKVFILSVIIIVLSSLYESFVWPHVMKCILGLLNL